MLSATSSDLSHFVSLYYTRPCLEYGYDILRPLLARLQYFRDHKQLVIDISGFSPKADDYPRGTLYRELNLRNLVILWLNEDKVYRYLLSPVKKIIENITFQLRNHFLFHEKTPSLCKTSFLSSLIKVLKDSWFVHFRGSS